MTYDIKEVVQETVMASTPRVLETEDPETALLAILDAGLHYQFRVLVQPEFDYWATVEIRLRSCRGVLHIRSIRKPEKATRIRYEVRYPGKRSQLQPGREEMTVPLPWDHPDFTSYVLRMIRDRNGFEAKLVGFVRL